MEMQMVCKHASCPFSCHCKSSLSCVDLYRWTHAGVFVVEEDIAAYTVRAIDDTRTLNKIMYMRPPVNIVSHNELIALWEKKAGRTFQIARIPEADLLKLIKGRVHPSLCFENVRSYNCCISDHS